MLWSYACNYQSTALLMTSGHVFAEDDIAARILAERDAVAKFKRNGYDPCGYKLTTVINPIDTEDALVSKEIIGTNWDKKVNWAMEKVLGNIADGRLRDGLNYVMMAVAEEAYNRGRLEGKKSDS